MILLFRRIMLFFLSAIIKLLWVFPINKNQILFSSFNGKYSDSPKYVFKKIRDKKVKCIWVIDPRSDFDIEDAIIVAPNSISYYYYMCTSKVIITNDFIRTFFPKRKGQVIINTWHGGGPLKKVGMVGPRVSEEERDFFNRHNLIYSCFLSSSRFVTEEVFRKSFGYTGTVLNTGMPRNAVLLRDYSEVKRHVKEYYGISSDVKIALYAPTFRGNASNASFLSDDQLFSTEKCLSALKVKFSSDFCILFRAHHSFKFDFDDNGVISASNYPDMQELLCASDVLVTDYSSCMNDEALMFKPVFLFCPDLVSYTNERGMYWDMHKLPFPLATNENEFLTNIVQFNDDEYRTKVSNYFNEIGSYDNDSSDVLVGNIILDVIHNEKQLF